MAGLPGTGLTGLFYLLLIFWLALREVFYVATRRIANGPARARETAWLASMAAAIVAVTWLEGWLLQGAVRKATGLNVSALSPALAISNFVVLASVIGGVHILRVLFPRKPVVEEGSPKEPLRRAA